MTTTGASNAGRTERRGPYSIAMIPGDGIGREVIPAAGRVLESLGLFISLEWLDAGWATFEQYGTALPDATVRALERCSGALFGAVSSPSHRVQGYSSPIIDLRKRLDLYGNLRPAASMAIAGSRADVDLLIVRENTECLYVKRETLDEANGVARAERVISRRASTRIAQLAFDQALSRAAARGGERPARVTIVHKANVLTVTDGLFRDACLDVAAQYPDVECEEQLVDSMAYRLILEPDRFDVIVAPNLYGDILSDESAALVGGLGLLPSANVGDGFVLAEPVHGSAPDIAGKGLANPIAAILSAAMLLRFLGEEAVARHVEGAVNQAVQDGAITADLGGNASTQEVTDAIIDALPSPRRAADERVDSS